MSDEAKRDFLGQAFDWSRWPKLAGIFQNRPRVNVYWQELADFVTSRPGYIVDASCDCCGGTGLRGSPPCCEACIAKMEPTK